MISGVNASAAASGVFRLDASAIKNAVLPAENSIVLVKVLERLNGQFKLLVDGNVFQAALPMALLKGDEFLAKVLKQKPFTLQADVLHSGRANNTVAAGLVKRLGLSGTLAESITTELVGKKKPVIKSRLEWILDKADEQMLHPDPMQMQLVVALSMIPIQELEESGSSVKELFQRSIQEVMKEIFRFVTVTLPSVKYPQGIAETVHAVLVKAKPPKNASPEKEIIDLIFRLKEVAAAVAVGGKQAYEAFIDNLVEYTLQKSVYNFFKIYPSFLIIREDAEYFLHIHNHSAEDEHSYRLSVDITGTKKQDPVYVRGMYEHPSLHIECSQSSWILPNDVLKRAMELFDETNISAFWKFYSGTRFAQFSQASVNVTV